MIIPGSGLSALEARALGEVESLATAGQQLRELSLPILDNSFVPDAERLLQNLTTQTNSALRADLTLLDTVLSESEIAAAVNPKLARVQYGNAVERLVKSRIESDPTLDSLYKHVGRKNNPDFVGKGLFENQLFDITTARQAEVHLVRPYGDGLKIITYDRPPSIP